MAVKFLKSAPDLAACPDLGLPEVAVIGRSNAGKSSLINAWLGGTPARVSQTPGKTEFLNFFKVDEEMVVVDLPGYGYASRSRTQRESWIPMVEDYLAGRDVLSGVLLIFDGQRPWSEDEDNLLGWLAHNGRKVLLVINKIDRLNQSEKAKLKNHLNKLGPEVLGTLWVSARNKIGIEELKRSVFENFVGS